MVTKPACGIPAAPILAAVAVIAIAIVWPKKILKNHLYFCSFSQNKSVKKTKKFKKKLKNPTGDSPQGSRFFIFS